MAKSKNSFFALIFRQKHIKRWGLMNSMIQENLSEHISETAILAHALAVIGNKYFGKSYDCGKVAELALFHDAPEVLTGDLPTPVKYFSPKMRESYAEIENNAINDLISRLPAEMAEIYSEILSPQTEEYKEFSKLVKAADKLSALIKATNETLAGNKEFESAKASTERIISEMKCPELDYFLEHFYPAFKLTLDEMQNN